MANKHPEIKVVVSDIDGTLLNSEHKLTEKSVEAIKAAIAQGVKFILATGKTRHSATDIYKRIGAETPGVFVQGLALNYPGAKEIHLAQLDADLLRRVITFAEERGFQVIAYSGSRILARRQTAETIILTESYDEPRPEIVGPIQNILGTTPINKIMFCGATPQQITHLRWQLSHMVGGSVHLTQALAEALELLPKGASKATALKVLFEEQGINPANVLAIGDGENDLEMLQLVGWGVAMGNGNPRLKAIAKATVGSNDEDGVAEAITKFVLKPAPVVETPKPVEEVKEKPKKDAPKAAETPAAEPAAETKGE